MDKLLPEFRNQRIVLGLVLGVALALLFDSLLLALIGGAVVVFFAPVLLGTVAVGAATGVAAGRANVLPRKSWRAIAMIAILLWPIAACGPIVLMKWRLYRVADGAIPVHSQMRRIQVTTDWLGDETFGQQTTLRFLTKLERSEVWDFYRGELLRRGWRETSYGNDGIAGGFTRDRERIRLWISAADAEGRFVDVTYSR